MRLLSHLTPAKIHNKRVLVRIDMNVPVKHGMVRDQFRIKSALKTIEFLRERGAKVILLSHIGREPEESLKPVAQVLRGLVPLSFVQDVTGRTAQIAVAAMQPGDVLLLENVRQAKGETENDPAFAQSLAALADIYVNDAFAVSHRAHASVVGVAKLLPSYAGLLVEEEVAQLSKALHPEGESLAILGGAKFDTKEPLIKKLLSRYSHLFLAGALVNDVFKAKGFEVGRSVVSEGVADPTVVQHEKLLLPTDVLVERPDGQAFVRVPQEVAPDEKIVDIGPEAFTALTAYIENAQFILWNGPTGWYEAGYDDWTHLIAQAVAKSDAFSVVGGGDTVAAIGSQGLEKEFSFLSTAGGAMLEFLLDGTLPGLKVLQ